MKKTNILFALVMLALTLNAAAAEKRLAYALMVVEGTKASINWGIGDVDVRELRSDRAEEPANPSYDLNRQAKLAGIRIPDDGSKRDERGTLIDLLNKTFGEDGWDLVTVQQNGSRTIYTFRRAK